MTNASLIGEVERSWITNLRKACESAGVHVKSDLEAARMALVCEGDIKEGVERVKNLRNYEEKYRLGEITAEDSLQVVSKEMPGLFFGFIGRDKTGRPVLLLANRNMNAGRLANEDNLLRHFINLMLHALRSYSSTLEDFNTGVVIVISAQSIGPKNFSLKVHKELTGLHQHALPVKVKEVHIVKGGLFFRSMFSLMKLLLTKKMQERIQVHKGVSGMEPVIALETIPDTEGGKGTFDHEKMSREFLSMVARFLAHEKDFEL